MNFLAFSFSLFSSLITILILNLIIIDFFKTRYKKKYNEPFYSILTILITLLIFFISMINSPFLILSTYALVFLFYGSTCFYSNDKFYISINTAFFVIVLLLNAFSLFSVESIFHFFNIDSSNHVYIIGIKMLFASLLQFAIYNSAKLYVFKSCYLYLKKEEFLTYLLFSLLCIGIMVFSASILNRVNQSLNFFSASLSPILVIFNILFLKMCDQISKGKYLESQLIFANKQVDMIYEHYSDLEEKELQSSFIIHDIKNHLQVIENSLVGNTVQCENYISEIKTKIGELQTENKTENKILNIYLKNKMKKAKKI